MRSRFSKPQQAAWGGFLSTYSHLNCQIEADLQEHSHITHVEFEVLLRLYWEPGHRLRIQDLAAQSILTQSGTSRVVDRLEKAGLLIRETAAEDRRGAYAVMTDTGQAHFRIAMEKHIDCVQQHFLRYFTDPELEILGEFWKRIEVNENPKSQPQ